MKSLLKHLDDENGGIEVCDLIARKGWQSGMDYMVAFHSLPIIDTFPEAPPLSLATIPGWQERKDGKYIMAWNSVLNEVYFMEEK